MREPATPARKVRFSEDVDDEEAEAVPPGVFVGQVNASLLQLKAAIGMDNPCFGPDDDGMPVWEGMRVLGSNFVLVER